MFIHKNRILFNGEFRELAYPLTSTTDNSLY